MSLRPVSSVTLQPGVSSPMRLITCAQSRAGAAVATASTNTATFHVTAFATVLEGVGEMRRGGMPRSARLECVRAIIASTHATQSSVTGWLDRSCAAQSTVANAPYPRSSKASESPVTEGDARDVKEGRGEDELSALAAPLGLWRRNAKEGPVLCNGKDTWSKVERVNTACLVRDATWGLGGGRLFGKHANATW